MERIYSNSQNEKKIDWTAVEGVISLYNKHFNTFSSKALLHLSFWAIYYILQWLYVCAQFSLSLVPASIFAFRNVLLSISSFYLLIYLFIPYLLLRKRYILFILSCLSLFWIDSIINYLLAKFINQYISIENPVIMSNMKRISGYSLTYILSLENVTEMFWGVVYISSFPILLKLSFDFMISVNKKAQLERENLLLELNFLKSQLNPHFLFNALNNIYALSYKKDDRAIDLILQLSDLMRYTLYETNTELVSLEKEIAFLYNYIELERVRYNKQTNIEFITDYKESDIKNVNIAPLIFFNFIENAFKYGINSTIYHAWVKVFINFKNGTFVLKVINSYNNTATDEITIDKGIGGIGLENTKKRLSILYPGKHDLKIEKTNSTFEVLLSINLA